VGVDTNASWIEDSIYYNSRRIGTNSSAAGYAYPRECTKLQAPLKAPEHVAFRFLSTDTISRTHGDVNCSKVQRYKCLYTEVLDGADHGMGYNAGCKMLISSVFTHSLSRSPFPYSTTSLTLHFFTTSPPHPLARCHALTPTHCSPTHLTFLFSPPTSPITRRDVGILPPVASHNTTSTIPAQPRMRKSGAADDEYQNANAVAVEAVAVSGGTTIACL